MKKTFVRSKKIYSSSRSAWANIRKTNKVSLKTHKVKAKHTARFYSWEVIAK